MTEVVQRLDARSGIEKLLVLVSPFLQSLYVLVMIGFALNEVFIVILLLEAVRAVFDWYIATLTLTGPVMLCPKR